ncbi:addiction module HigA family antidote [Rhizobium azooxidifex]|uniref:Addiction module HigA family antidote n=1 Tax=Mycoplana azooxidifex TaxID=1636188 RepID=A0A7W6D9S0_9HYPH|nr:HigA family addiction module antitoxin [Mycoplana azooxidifex]MBB3975823.1 addiction module HigA family antidote [Mycoplana azooxidifex]
MSVANMPAIHPGEILRDLYLEPLDMSAGALAKKLNVPRTRIERIVTEKIGITSDTALRLARYFDTTPEFWMNLQTGYDLKVEAERMHDEIDRIPVHQAA